MNIGSFVKIRKDLKEDSTYGDFTFRCYMNPYKGHFARVIKITPPRENEICPKILIDIDGGKYYWNEQMFSIIDGENTFLETEGKNNIMNNKWRFFWK